MSDVTATSSEGFPVPVRIPRAIHDAIAAMGAGPDVDAVWTALQQADDIDAAGPTLSSDSRDLLQWASHRLRHDQRVIIGQSQLLLLVLLQVGDDARTNADHPVTPGAGLREPDDDPRSWRVGDRTTYHDPAGVDVDISPLQSQHL